VTRKLAERVVVWRWYIIAGWIVLGALLVVLAPSLDAFTSSGYGLPASYQSTQAETIAVKDFPSVASASGIIAVNATDNSVLTAPELQKIDALATALRGDHIDSVTSVTTSPLFLSKNQKIQLIQVAMTGQPGDDGPNAAVARLRTDTDTFLAGSGLRSQLTGNAAISVDQASEWHPSSPTRTASRRSCPCSTPPEAAPP
jgi:RND superfamily putative drug exporter